MAYKYTCLTIKPDGTKITRNLEMSTIDLYHKTGEVNYLGFLRLLSRWNRMNYFPEPGSPIHIYCAKEPMEWQR